MELREKPSIAGAVVREIERIEKSGDSRGEGTGYKAAWNARLSRWENHTNCFARDAFAAARPQKMRLAYAVLEGVEA